MTINKLGKHEGNEELTRRMGNRNRYIIPAAFIVFTLSLSSLTAYAYVALTRPKPVPTWLDYLIFPILLIGSFAYVKAAKLDIRAVLGASKRSMLLCSLILIFLLLVSWLIFGLTNLQDDLQKKPAIVLDNFLRLFILVGFVEEFEFRGYFQSHLLRLSKSRVSALSASSIAFALTHVPELFLRFSFQKLPPSDISLLFIQQLVVGFFFGSAYLLSGNNLVAVWIIHGYFDFSTDWIVLPEWYQNLFPSWQIGEPVRMFVFIGMPCILLILLSKLLAMPILQRK